MVQYAQIDDYYQFTTGSPAPDDLDDATIAKLNNGLQRASNTVKRLVRSASIAWDSSTGMATDANVARGLADATCAQLAWFNAAGFGDITGASSQFSDVGMGPVRLAKNNTAAAAVSAADARHAPEVDDILAGLDIWTTKVAHPGWVR